MNASVCRLVLFASLFGGTVSGRAAEPEPPRLVFDFEHESWDGWTVEGAAFGDGPSAGDVAPQDAVAGYLGERLLNGFHGGDEAVGTLTSPPFRIDRDRLRVLVGGGGVPGLAVELVVGGEVVRSASGFDDETISPRIWPVEDLRGKQARLRVRDEAKGAWGHLLVDQVELLNEVEGPVVTAGEFRRILDPGANDALRFGINDHCFVKSRKGTWHLFGIHFSEPLVPHHDGQELAHATSRRLTEGWEFRETALRADRDRWKEIHVWAPHVVRHDDRWWMFYCAGDPDRTRYRMHVATSADLVEWKRHKANPLFQDGFQARDPCVVRIEDEWVMYYTATSSPGGGHHTVAARSSTDLLEWSEPRIVFRDSRRGTEWGPTESPQVIRRGEWWYLFVGPTPDYTGTDVYRSRDPFEFPLHDRVGHLRAHAPELVQDDDGQWYVSHCGHRQGGVWLAPLWWNDGLPQSSND